MGGPQLLWWSTAGLLYIIHWMYEKGYGLTWVAMVIETEQKKLDWGRGLATSQYHGEQGLGHFKQKIWYIKCVKWEQF